MVFFKALEFPLRILRYLKGLATRSFGHVVVLPFGCLRNLPKQGDSDSLSSRL